MGWELDTSKFEEALKALGPRFTEAVIAGVRDAGLQILGNAQELAPVGGKPFSPYDEAPGTLKASGTWDGPRVEDGSVGMVIGFNTVYAAVQHENLKFRHKEGTQAKYLEVPMRQAQAEQMVERSIAYHVELMTKGATG